MYRQIQLIIKNNDEKNKQIGGGFYYPAGSQPEQERAQCQHDTELEDALDESFRWFQTLHLLWSVCVGYIAAVGGDWIARNCTITVNVIPPAILSGYTAAGEELQIGLVCQSFYNGEPLGRFF